MDKLWAPWRITYVQKKQGKKCIFCAAHAQDKGHVVFTTAHALCILNIFPYNNGHLMVAPKRHVASLAGLNDAQMLDLMKALLKAQRLLQSVLKPDGFNIGINVSEAAGAGIPGHAHIHIVPRWKGDTNFMPVLFNTKIISQSLGELLRRLRDADATTD